MHYDPRKDNCPLPFDPFKSCTVPRPIGWISTISRTGETNLAPFSQWQNITYDPPIVMFSADQHVDARKKDTVINAEETGYFVWNMATYDLREAVNKSAQPVARGVDEFEIAGVTKAPCIEAPGPRVQPRGQDHQPRPARPRRTGRRHPPQFAQEEVKRDQRDQRPVAVFRRRPGA